MKLQVIAPLAMAAAAGANGFAPIDAVTPTTIATDATVQQNHGNAKITAHPGPPADHAAYQQLH